MLSTETNGLFRFIQAVLFFPMHFQQAFIAFAWGAESEQFWWLLSKRLLFLLPVLAIILACWTSIACIISVLIRQNRKEFVLEVFNAWMDLAKGIAAFWAGLVNMIFKFLVTLTGIARIVLLSIWAILQEVVFTPFRLFGHLGRNLATSSIPWIAVVLTLFWCLIEATIFTYVTTPLVVDTFSNITGDNLTETTIRIPLFIFLLFIVLGSYAVLSTFVTAIQKKNISAIIGIGVIETVVLFVEVVFLYREFVDALVPWFAQYSENFELGIFWTLAISTFAWFGIRSLSWFLFAEHGTPTIMAVIQGKGLQLEEHKKVDSKPYQPVAASFFHQLKADYYWIQQAGDNMLQAVILPPMQIVTAAINFVLLLFSGKPLAALPLKSLQDIQRPTSRDDTPEPVVVSENNDETYDFAKHKSGVTANVETQ